jgi:hypothetical protein
MQIIDAAPPDQIGPADCPSWVNQHIMLASAQQHTAHHTPIQCVEGYPIQTHQTVGARVIANAAVWAKLLTGLALLGLDRFDGFNSLGAGADGELRAQVKAFARLTLDPMVGRVGIDDTFIPTHLCNPGSRRVEGALCRGQNCLMAIHVHFDGDSAGECTVHMLLF